MGELVELTVPGEARSRRSRGPCPAQAGRCSCLVPAWEHRLQRGALQPPKQPKSHHNKVWVPFSLPSLGFALGWPTKAAPWQVCNTLFLPRTQLIQQATTAVPLRM